MKINKELIFGLGMLVIVTGILIYVLVYTHNTINSLSSQEINDAYGKIRPLMIFVEISAWGLLAVCIVGYKRIQKVWHSKKLPMYMIIVCVIAGIGGMFIPV